MKVYTQFNKDVFTSFKAGNIVYLQSKLCNNNNLILFLEDVCLNETLYAAKVYDVKSRRYAMYYCFANNIKFVVVSFFVHIEISVKNLITYRNTENHREYLIDECSSYGNSLTIIA